MVSLADNRLTICGSPSIRVAYPCLAIEVVGFLSIVSIRYWQDCAMRIYMVRMKSRKNSSVSWQTGALTLFLSCLTLIWNPC